MLKSLYSVLYELQPLRLGDITGLIVVGGQVIVLFGKAFTIACKTLISSISTLSFKTIGVVVSWVFGAIICHRVLDTFSLYIMATLFAMIFLNLGERKPGELSAYSVFNDGFEEILGTLNAKQFDREIRHADMMADDNHEESDNDEPDYYIPSDDEDITDDNNNNSSAEGITKKTSNARRKTEERDNRADDEEYIEILRRREIAKKVQTFQLGRTFERLSAKLMVGIEKGHSEVSISSVDS